MERRALAVSLTGLALAGCYVTARGGPARSFGGERRDPTVEVLLGAEMHFDADGLARSPLTGHTAVFNSAGLVRASAAGAAHDGALYEIGASAMIALRRRPSPSNGLGSGTFVRADASGGIGKLAGVEGSSNTGTIVRVMGLVELEYYRDGWATRVGGGVALQSVTVGEVMGREQSEGSYAPVGALTFEYTPLVVQLLRGLLGG